MKTKLIIALAALLLLSSSTLATDTRVLTMGENNMVLLDEANITIFPSRLNDFPKLVIGEISFDGLHQLGVHWQFGSDNPWHLGTYISTREIGEPMGYYNGFAFGNFTGTAHESDRRVDLYYGRELIIGPWQYFGFHIGYARASNDVTTTGPPTAWKERLHFCNFDFGWTNGAKDRDIAFHLGLGTWTDEALGYSSETESDPNGFWDMGVRGRWFTTVIWHAEFGYGKRGVKDHLIGDGDPTTKDDLVIEDKRLTFDFGCGYNWTPVGNVLVVGDVGLAYEKVDRDHTASADYPGGPGGAKFEHSRWFFPYWSIGLDADVFRWMDIRLGASSDWVIEKYKRNTNPADLLDVNTDETHKMAENEIYLGFGFHWGRLHVDTQTDPNMFLRGFDFISGAGGGYMNWQISVLYELM